MTIKNILRKIKKLPLLAIIAVIFLLSTLTYQAITKDKYKNKSFDELPKRERFYRIINP